MVVNRTLHIRLYNCIGFVLVAFGVAIYYFFHTDRQTQTVLVVQTKRSCAVLPPTDCWCVCDVCRMSGVKDVKPIEFITAFADFLKSKNVEVPEWASYVKTGAFKELAPQEDDWYFTRMAAVARQVFVRGATGVGMFKRIYGGTLRRGSRPTHNTTGSGAVARSCLNNLEKLGYLERDANNMRIVSSEGKRNMNRIAVTILQAKMGAVEDEEADEE